MSRCFIEGNMLLFFFFCNDGGFSRFATAQRTGTSQHSPIHFRPFFLMIRRRFFTRTQRTRSASPPLCSSLPQACFASHLRSDSNQPLFSGSRNPDPCIKSDRPAELAGDELSDRSVTSGAWGGGLFSPSGDSFSVSVKKNPKKTQVLFSWLQPVGTSPI